MAPVIHILWNPPPYWYKSVIPWFFNAHSRQLPYYIDVQNSLLKLRHYMQKHYNSTKLRTTFRKCGEGKTYWNSFCLCQNLIYTLELTHTNFFLNWRTSITFVFDDWAFASGACCCPAGLFVTSFWATGPSLSFSSCHERLSGVVDGISGLGVPWRPRHLMVQECSRHSNQTTLKFTLRLVVSTILTNLS